ncbi:MAG: ABATE domain-containing protein [Acidobacteriota bacterium]
MLRAPRSLDTLDRCGNSSCLDFVNTVHSRTVRDPHDYLATYADLLQWTRDGGFLSPRRLHQLASVARSQPRQAVKALRRAAELRELLYRVFLSLARERKSSATDLAAINYWLGAVLPHRRLKRTGTRLRWSWEEAETLQRPLWPVVLSAAELLANVPRRRLRECPAPDGCGWLFLDTSKNGSRRWCSMRTCGNIAKARRFHKKTRQAPGAYR